MTGGLPKFTSPVLGPRAAPATTERRTTILNDNKITSGAPPSSRSAADYGKFFPRGMRGTLEEIQVYCKGDASDSLTVSVSPQPGLGPTHETTITPAATWGWQEAAFNIMWNFDSMYIWISDCEAEVLWGYDDEEDRDGHYTNDSGATFTDLDERPFFRAVMTGETAGDVPVSGTINSIPIPAASSRFETESKAVPKGVETTIVEVEGGGYCDYIEFSVPAAAASHNTQIWIYCDGVVAYAGSISMMNGFGWPNEHPVISLVAYAVAGICFVTIQKRFEFRRKFEVRALNNNGAQTVSVWAHPTLIK